jgi:hypothetical protein
MTCQHYFVFQDHKSELKQCAFFWIQLKKLLRHVVKLTGLKMSGFKEFKWNKNYS